ncbi:hypothetical protein GCM10011538_16580 [Ligilactobacillus murinus]
MTPNKNSISAKVTELPPTNPKISCANNVGKIITTPKKIYANCEYFIRNFRYNGNKSNPKIIPVTSGYVLRIIGNSVL